MAQSIATRGMARRDRRDLWRVIHGGRRHSDFWCRYEMFSRESDTGTSKPTYRSTIISKCCRPLSELADRPSWSSRTKSARLARRGDGTRNGGRPPARLWMTGVASRDGSEGSPPAVAPNRRGSLPSDRARAAARRMQGKSRWPQKARLRRSRFSTSPRPIRFVAVRASAYTQTGAG